MAAKKKVDGRSKEGRAAKAKAAARRAAALKDDPKPKAKPKLKPVRGTTKKTVDKAKLHKVTKKDPRPRVGSVVLFTQGEGRRMTFGLGVYESKVGNVANVIVGEKPVQRVVFAGVHELYKPLPTEKALHAFLIESIRAAYERGFKAGEHSALGKTHSAEPEKYVSEQTALLEAEEEAPKADDLSVLYAAYAMQSPKSQQVVERAEDVLNDNSKAAATAAAILSVPEEEFPVPAETMDAIIDEAIGTVHEEPSEAEKLAIIAEVQKAPLL